MRRGLSAAGKSWSSGVAASVSLREVEEWRCERKSVACSSWSRTRRSFAARSVPWVRSQARAGRDRLEARAGMETLVTSRNLNHLHGGALIETRRTLEWK